MVWDIGWDLSERIVARACISCGPALRRRVPRAGRGRIDHAGDLLHDMDAERRPRDADRLIGELATKQAGVVARRQLMALGIGRGAMEHRLAAGRLRHVPGHRGVFSVGHAARAPRTATWAAHLALGPRSVVSHRSAAWLRGLRDRPARAELTVLGSGRRRSTFRVHRTSWLPAHHATEIDGLRVATLARLLLDLAATGPARQVEHAVDQAEVIRILDVRPILELLDEAGRRPGVATLRAVLGRDSAGSTLSDSDLAEMLFAIIRGAGLPEPRHQMWILGYQPDFAWPAERLIAEADGAATHGTRRGHAHDTRRDVVLTNGGWTVLRFAYTHIVRDPGYVAEALRVALARARRSA
jgi:very-short-patch-repair endonuclease/predicted transcriptional regulator of viral defense system